MIALPSPCKTQQGKMDDAGAWNGTTTYKYVWGVELLKIVVVIVVRILTKYVIVVGIVFVVVARIVV